jgi:hypothetical protein
LVDDDESLIACDPIGSWRHYVRSFPVRRPPRPRSVCRRRAATFPAPAWPIPDLSDLRNTKERQRKVSPVPYSSAVLYSSPSSCSSHSSPSSRSAPSSPAPSGPILRPTSVVRRKSKLGRVHRSSANKSRILKRPFPLPVSHRSSANRIFCCGFPCGHFVNRCSRGCILHGHHPHFAVARFFDHWRYCPVRQSPVFSW